MVSRNLTEFYVLMRNNAIQSRHIYAEQPSLPSDQVRLMSDRDIESNHGMELRESAIPPPWTAALEESHYILLRLKEKIDDLKRQQSEHLHRPSLDQLGAEEEKISRLTTELTRLFNSAHRLVQSIRDQGRIGSKIEQRLANNVVSSLVSSLQELSFQFRNAQSNYLKSLTSREERNNAFFEMPNFEELSLEEELLPGLNDDRQTDKEFVYGSAIKNAAGNFSGYYDEYDVEQVLQNTMLTQKQLLAFAEDSTKLAKEREDEVNKIVKSVIDLNDIFKDLGQMVHEQGSVLDRIDYNVEMAHSQVQEGLKQIKKAATYQKKNRKVKCVLATSVTIFLIIIILIIQS